MVKQFFNLIANKYNTVFEPHQQRDLFFPNKNCGIRCYNIDKYTILHRYGRNYIS